MEPSREPSTSTWVKISGTPSGTGHPFASKLNPEAAEFVVGKQYTVLASSSPNQPIAPFPFSNEHIPVAIQTNFTLPISQPINVTNFPDRPFQEYISPKSPVNLLQNYLPSNEPYPISEPIAYQNELNSQWPALVHNFPEETVEPTQTEEFASETVEVQRPDCQNLTSSWHKEDYRQPFERRGAYNNYRDRGPFRGNRGSGRGNYRGAFQGQANYHEESGNNLFDRFQDERDRRDKRPEGHERYSGRGNYRGSFYRQSNYHEEPGNTNVNQFEEGHARRGQQRNYRGASQRQLNNHEESRNTNSNKRFEDDHFKSSNFPDLVGQERDKRPEGHERYSGRGNYRGSFYRQSNYYEEPGNTNVNQFEEGHARRGQRNYRENYRGASQRHDQEESGNTNFNKRFEDDRFKSSNLAELDGQERYLERDRHWKDLPNTSRSREGTGSRRGRGSRDNFYTKRDNFSQERENWRNTGNQTQSSESNESRDNTDNTNNQLSNSSSFEEPLEKNGTHEGTEAFQGVKQRRGSNKDHRRKFEPGSNRGRQSHSKVRDYNRHNTPDTDQATDKNSENIEQSSNEQDVSADDTVPPKPNDDSWLAIVDAEGQSMGQSTDTNQQVDENQSMEASKIRNKLKNVKLQTGQEKWRGGDSASETINRGKVSKKYVETQRLVDPRMEREKLNKSDSIGVVNEQSDSGVRGRRSEGSYKSKHFSSDMERFTEGWDKEYDSWKTNWREIKDFKIVVEIQDNLFEQPKDYCLAHCVAEDLRMGSGIAVDFKREFKGLSDLLEQKAKEGGLALLPDEKNGRFIYYLVTKKESAGKPTYFNLWKSLCEMKKHIKENELKKLAIPRLGCGLDRLEWDKVKSMIEHLFRDIDIEIKVCNFQQNESTEEKRSKCKLIIEENIPITEIARGTLILYFASSQNEQDDIMEQLAKKFAFLAPFRQQEVKNLGDIVYYDDKVQNCGVCGCIVRATNQEQISFKSLHKCIQNINKMNNKFGNDAFQYLAFQWVDQTAYFDELINQKIITMLINYLRNFDVYVCRGSFKDEGD